MIRRAEEKDIPKVMKLLSQVLEIHAGIRPDVFLPGTTKYSGQELTELFRNDRTPVYVIVDGNNEVLGYAFCVIRERKVSRHMKPRASLFIDDLCIDEARRHETLGEQLFRFVTREAVRLGCEEVCLTVWEGNDAARRFYEKMGMRPKETLMELPL